MSNGYELGTAETLEEVMDVRTNQFDSLKTQELQTQWKHKTSSVPEADGITDRWWTYTSGVSRSGPEVAVPGGETIRTNQSGNYIVGTPALAGGAARVEGTAQSGAGDDWWTGYTDRINEAAADDNGAGIGYKYFDKGEGDNGGANEAGHQEYVWFKSGVSGVSDKVVPRDQWNGDELEFSIDIAKGSLFHRGGFVRTDYTYYNQGGVKVNYGVKTESGGVEIKTLHSFNVADDPMWVDSDLQWQMGTLGTNLTGYINAAHYKAGSESIIVRRAGTGRDGTVLGSGLSSLTTGTAYPVISFKIRQDWDSVSVKPTDFSVEMDDSFYVFTAVDTTLGANANFEAPNSELSGVSPASSEYAVLADNDATSLNDNGEFEKISYVASASAANGNTTVEGTAPDLALEPGTVVTLGVVPINAATLVGASFEWGSTF